MVRLPPRPRPALAGLPAVLVLLLAACAAGDPPAGIAPASEEAARTGALTELAHWEPGTYTVSGSVQLRNDRRERTSRTRRSFTATLDVSQAGPEEMRARGKLCRRLDLERYQCDGVEYRIILEDSGMRGELRTWLTERVRERSGCLRHRIVLERETCVEWAWTVEPREALFRSRLRFALSNDGGEPGGAAETPGD